MAPNRMAQALTTTLGSWEAENVTLGQVEAALSDLRRSEERAAVRTSVLTLVVAIEDPEKAPEILEVVRQLGGRHPSRSLVLVLAGEDGSGIDAQAALHVTEREGSAVCFEDVVLEVRGRARHHLDSVVEPFTLPDLPVAVWCPFSLPSPGNPLLAAADRIVIDSRFLPGNEEVLRRAARLARRFPVTDLSWVRLAPWRSLLAGLFEGTVGRPFLGGVHRVEVAGNFGPRHLLGGWLIRSLGLRPASVHLEAAPHVSIALDAAVGRGHARFVVERRSDEKVIHSTVEVQDGICQEQSLAMHDPSRSAVLVDALTRMGRDEVYERSLFGALELLA